MHIRIVYLNCMFYIFSGGGLGENQADLKSTSAMINYNRDDNYKKAKDKTVESEQ